MQSIYFGGGTPSLLTDEELAQIFRAIEEAGYRGGVAGAMNPATSTEITLEANPDDLSPEKIATLAASPVNRLSVGIQSFDEGDLRFMNRAHSAEEARTAVQKVVAAGFHDLSIDLIYGGQTTTDTIWQKNLALATDLGVNHISSYALTVEPKTALGHRVATGRIPDTSEERFERQFYLLIDHLAAQGYEHYEISNFALPGHRSRHNSGYWTGQPYLGVGPGAHSFDGAFTRRWNVSNNNIYAKAWADIDDHAAFLAAENLLFEAEVLTVTDRYNEFIMTGLRRSEGVEMSEVRNLYGPDLADRLVAAWAEYLRGDTPQMTEEKGIYRLTRRGLLLADGIAAAGFQ